MQYIIVYVEVIMFNAVFETEDLYFLQLMMEIVPGKKPLSYQAPGYRGDLS